MSIMKSLATVVAASVLAAGAVLAVAAPASAVDEGAIVPGNIYWFSAPGGLEANSAATQIDSGAHPRRPWVTIATDGVCPALTVSVQAALRIPQANVPEADWVQVPLTAPSVKRDSQGRPWIDTLSARLNLPDVFGYNAANGGTGVFPLILACRDDSGTGTGYFTTPLTITGTTDASVTYSIPRAALASAPPAVATPTTTTLTGAASGPNLALTATVTPAGAVGAVTFSEGATVLGTAPVVSGIATLTLPAPQLGARTFSARFGPTDPTAFVASDATPIPVTVSPSAGGDITLDVPAVPVVVPDGSLTFTVPFDRAVPLVGARNADNSRVLAAAPFPTVTVTDTRRDALLKDWQVNAQASDFVGTTNAISGTTISAKYLGWKPAVPTIVRDIGSLLNATAGPDASSSLDVSLSEGLSKSALLGRSSVLGRGVTTLNAGLLLAIPGTTAQGAYTSTVTVTLISG